MQKEKLALRSLHCSRQLQVTVNTWKPDMKPRSSPQWTIGRILVYLVCGVVIVWILTTVSFPSQERGDGRSTSQTKHPERVDRWFEGGTLHNASLSRWRQASHRNKLATASDWLSSTIWKGHLTSLADVDRLKAKSDMLVRGIDEAISTTASYDTTSVRTLAAFLIRGSSDLGP